MSHQTTLHRFFTAVTFAPLRLGRAPHTAPPSSPLRQMVLTDFFQRAAAVAGACAGEAKIKNEPPATSTAPSSPAVSTSALESRVRGLLAKRKCDMANIDETRYSDPDFGDVNWELDQTFGEVSEWLESYLDKHEEAKRATERYLWAYERRTQLGRRKNLGPPDSPDRLSENQPDRLFLLTCVNSVREGGGGYGRDGVARKGAGVTGAAHRRGQTRHNNPYRPNMGISLGTDLNGVENEHTVRGGAVVKGNIKI
ncbi:hypothetical protein B0H14DRAFT_2576736 [Mycena olivaceomarginata]|nr:hypothetical protein B0H14DRAFT_2576736 [Mycena olivaceomarginata]